jgi:hypothetical protein
MTSLDQAQVTISVALGICALVGVVVAHFRWVRPRYRSGKDMFVAGRDSLIGRPAIVDTITGKEISPALPGVGVRLANVEAGQLETRDALRHIAAVMEGQQIQDRRIDRLESDVQSLKDAAVERVVAKAESAAAWRAVEAVANNGDTTHDEPELD